MRTVTLSVRVALLVQAALLLAAVAGAMGFDNSGARIVVPYVVYAKGLDTTVFIENHETRDVPAVLYYVGAQQSSTPGRQTCQKVTLLASSVTKMDVRAFCALRGPADAGTLTVMEWDKTDVARISATARVDSVDPSSPGSPDGFSEDAIPLGSLEGTNAIQVVHGLRSGATGLGTYRTDCYMGTFTDATATGVLGRLTLKDQRGVPLGSSLYFTLKPWDLVRFEDVFATAGVGGSPISGARAEFGLAGGNAAVVGYCQVVSVSSPEPAATFHLAKVVEPEYQARRREIVVENTPMSTPSGRTFTLQPADDRTVHGIYLQHPDTLSCEIDNMNLVLTLTAPDSAMTTFGGTSNAIAEFDIGARSAFVSKFNGNGYGDLWGLEVTRSTSLTAPFAPQPYRIHCKSGNGISLADEIFKN